jgi:predicted metal-dependent hydrolase
MDTKQHKDPTHQWETMMEDVSNEVVKSVRELTPKIANRPIGKVKVPQDLARDEWAMRDETWMQQKHQELMQDPDSGGNEIKALLLLAEHDKKMQEAK